MDEARDGAYKRAMRFLSELSGRDPHSISSDEPLSNFDADSLNYVEFFMALEDERDVEVPQPVPNLQTVADLIALVRSVS